MRTAWANQNRYIDYHAAVFPLDNSPDGGISVLRPVLLILMAVAGVVLLITCANLPACCSRAPRHGSARLRSGCRWALAAGALSTTAG
jgi:hypothetical protein